MIEISGSISIGEEELLFEAVRSGGPGGQKVNKTSSAVVLKFDVRNSPNLPQYVKTRLEELHSGRVNREGFLVIHARRHRSLTRNRESAVSRLINLIREAAEILPERKPTQPSAASKRDRLKDKKHRGKIKKNRKYTPSEDDLE